MLDDPPCTNGSWSFDGDLDHSFYKKSFKSKCAVINDESIFVPTSLPLRLVTANNITLWNNRSTQSPRFYHPTKILFAKESEEDNPYLNREK